MCASVMNGEGCPVAVRRSEFESLKAKVAEQAAEILRLRNEAEARLADTPSISDRSADGLRLYEGLRIRFESAGSVRN
jgi:hypothetical protein